MYNTIIIGAGPVGSHLAFKLGQLGHKVAVLDKKSHIDNDICCTGIVGKECFNLLNIDDELILKYANSAKFFFPSGKSIRLWRNDDVAYIIDRPALNTELAKRAQASGADGRLNRDGAAVYHMQVADDQRFAAPSQPFPNPKKHCT